MFPRIREASPAGQGRQLGPSWADPRMEGVGRALERDYTPLTVGSLLLFHQTVFLVSLFVLTAISAPPDGQAGRDQLLGENNQEDRF